MPHIPRAGLGYYRSPSAPPPDDDEYSRCVLARASAAGAAFVACAKSVGEVGGYEHRVGVEGAGYYLLPGMRDVAWGEGEQGEQALHSEEEVAAWLKKQRVVLSDGCPPPLLSFAAARLPPTLLAQLSQAGFDAPSPIQAAAWPPAMDGRDLIAIAKTGSGKTLAYLAPAIRLIDSKPELLVSSEPAALVLAPTRELATQIHAEAERFGGSSGVASVALYGGAPREAQLVALQRGVHLIVATPGRLNDFINSGQVELEGVLYVVLDEADRMLDMGFEPQIREALRQVPRGRRQMLMFSATWPVEVRSLAAELLNNPCKVKSCTLELKSTRLDQIESS